MKSDIEKCQLATVLSSVIKPWRVKVAARKLENGKKVSASVPYTVAPGGGEEMNLML